MNTTTQEYKGFSIDTVSYDGLGTVRFTYFVKGAQFKPEGYATLNNAKGAITKHLNGATVVVDIEAVQGAIVGKKVTGIITDGLNPPSDKRSRNQREGGYSGKFAEFNATFSKVSVRHRRAGATGNYDILKDIKYTRTVGL